LAVGGAVNPFSTVKDCPAPRCFETRLADIPEHPHVPDGDPTDFGDFIGICHRQHDSVHGRLKRAKRTTTHHERPFSSIPPKSAERFSHNLLIKLPLDLIS